MASHTTLIDALNAIAIVAGGSGGHKFLIDALNDWSVAQSGTGGHRYTIDALNEIAGLYGAAGGHKFDHLALNAISVALSGVGGHALYLAALNEIVDLPALSGGGGEGYSTTAVDFDGVTTLIRGEFDFDELTTTNGLVATDNGFLSFSAWIKTIDGNSDPLIFVADPLNNYTNQFNGGSGVSNYVFRATSADANLQLQLVGSAGGIPDAVWTHIIGTCSTNHASGSKIIKLKKDGVDWAGTKTDNAIAFTMAFNGLMMSVLNDAADGNFEGAAADVWIAPGQSLLTAGDISAETIAKFRDGSGKPVSLGADGSVPTGVAPAVFFSKNNQDATGFSENRGTGGAFTLVGALTDSATSPSD